MKSLIPPIFMLFGLMARAGGVYVGNGGVGVIKGDEVHLLDIEGSADHSAVPIRLFVDPWTRSYDFGELERTLDIPPSSVRMILSDIERHYPRVGRVLAQTIHELRWKLTDKKLELPRDLSVNELIDRVLIANRHLQTVNIRKDILVKMPLYHRLALVIHEAFYGIYIPQCRQALENSCRLQLRSELRNAVRQLLLDHISPEEFKARHLPRWNMNWNIQNSASAKAVLDSGSALELEALYSPAARTQFAEKVCAQAQGRPFDVVLDRNSFYLNWFTTITDQLQAYPQPLKSRVQFRVKERFENCPASLEAKMNRAVRTDAFLNFSNNH